MRRGGRKSLTQPNAAKKNFKNDADFAGKQSFTQLPLGNTEKHVGVAVRITNLISEAQAYLRTNAIPGEAIFYQLIQVILAKYYRIQYGVSTKELFKGACAYEGIAELVSHKDGRFFDEIKPKKAKQMYPNAIRSRLRFIERYAKMGPPFPPPIYIQEKILEDIIGRRTDDNTIIMVDGARRIVAGCLCRLREMKVILITQKKSENFNARSGV